MRDEKSNDQDVSEAGQNKKTTIIVGVIVVVALIVIGWAVFSGGEPEPIPEQEIVMPEPPKPEPMPEVEVEPIVPEVVPERTPRTDRVVTEEKEEPKEPRLPGLQNSTPPLLNTLGERKVNTRPVRSDNAIRDFVAFIDNVAAGVIARDSAIIKGPEARFTTEELDGKLFINPQSYQRYDNIVDWFVEMDNDALIAVFSQFEPLFDEAYAEISRPGAAFRERLERAVNLLNATPEQAGLIELKSDKIMYTYADSQLESLPAAQRQMLRLGSDNMARVKVKLNNLLNALNN